MADTLKKLGQITTDNTNQTGYTVPASTTTLVKHIMFANLTAGDVEFKMWHDGSANANLLIPKATIPADGHAEWEGLISMETGDTLVFNGPNNGITITIYGVEITP